MRRRHSCRQMLIISWLGFILSPSMSPSLPSMPLELPSSLHYRLSQAASSVVFSLERGVELMEHEGEVVGVLVGVFVSCCLHF
jgi:hypothetical protein